MNTNRMLPPINVQQQDLTDTGGHRFTGTPGMVFDVSDIQANFLVANGWLRVAFSGPTNARPTAWGPVNSNGAQYAGATYFDTTLGYLIVYDGANWRNPSTGAAV